MQTEQLLSAESTVTCDVTDLAPTIPIFLNNIMDQGHSTGAQQPDGLRERIVSYPDSTGGRDALTATGEVEIKDDAGKDKKTFGRTPDGTGKLVFVMIVHTGRVLCQKQIGKIGIAHSAKRC